MRHAADSKSISTNAAISSGFSTKNTDSPEISLRRVLPTARFTSGDISVEQIAESPEMAKQGDLVVYRIGEADPNKLIADALARGAVGILTEQLLPCPLPQCIVGDVELAMAAITTARLGRPDRKLFTVGVIGSAGKTTTCLLLSSLFRANRIRTAYQTDLGCCDGIVQATPATSHVGGTALVQWLEEACDTESQAAVIELSDNIARHGGYDAIEFDLIVITGSAIGSGDFGPCALQCVLERLTQDGVIVAPADDTKAMQTVQEHGGKSVTYGVRQSADLTAKMIDQSGGMSTLLINHEETSAVMETTLCGGANAANHAAAILVGLLLDEPLQDVVEKVSQLRDIPGRGQRLSSFEHADVVLEVGGSPERVAASLRTFRSMKSGGRLWVVQAIDAGESPETLARYGNLIERFSDHSILTSQPSTKASFLAASHHVLDGVEDCAAMRLVADRTRAIQWAVSEAKPSDTILVITGQQPRNPAMQRAELQSLEATIHEARRKNDVKPSKPKLKIFS